MKIQEEMHSLFNRGGFLLHKWNCSDPSVLKSISLDSKDPLATIVLTDTEQYTKTLRIEWDASNDHFRVNVSEFPPVKCMTKRSLISDVAKTFDALGWFSPTIVKAKILLQMLWLEKVGGMTLCLNNGQSGDKSPQCFQNTTSHVVTFLN